MLMQINRYLFFFKSVMMSFLVFITHGCFLTAIRGFYCLGMETERQKHINGNSQIGCSVAVL